jgi:hypothetical protein
LLTTPPDDAHPRPPSYALRSVADHGQGSRTREANLEVQQIAAEALALLLGDHAPDTDA